jgi:hypothetical protein
MAAKKPFNCVIMHATGTKPGQLKNITLSIAWRIGEVRVWTAEKLNLSWKNKTSASLRIE